MEPDPKVDEIIFRERVLNARRMSPEEKILSGFRLFDLQRHYMGEEIRAEFPNASERLVQMILARRLARIRASERPPAGFSP